jgi:hypothetical protein
VASELPEVQNCAHRRFQTWCREESFPRFVAPISNPPPFAITKVGHVPTDIAKELGDRATLNDEDSYRRMSLAICGT